MKRQLKRKLMTALLVGSIFFGAISSVLAAADATGVSFSANSNCSSVLVTFLGNVSGSNFFEYNVTNDDGASLSSFSVPFGFDFTDSVAFPLGFSAQPEGTIIGYYFKVGVNPTVSPDDTAEWFVMFECSSSGQSELLISCSGAVGTCPTTAQEGIASLGPPDDRLNFGYGDAHIGILYPANGAVDLYLYATGQYIENFLAASEIPSAPSAYTLLKQEGIVNVGILPSGELQFGFGPGPEGKVYTLIMANIDGSGRYGFKYDPNE